MSKHLDGCMQLWSGESEHCLCDDTREILRQVDALTYEEMEGERDRLARELYEAESSNAELRGEVERLKGERDRFRDSALMYAAMVGTHVGTVLDGYKSQRCTAGIPGCDDRACVCVCHELGVTT